MGGLTTVPADPERIAAAPPRQRKGDSILSRFMQDRHKRMSRMLGYTLTMGEPEAWGGFSTVCRARLTVCERAGMAVAALRGATHLRAAFPYGAETELAPGRREIFAARAFSDRIEAGEDIHLLAGHDWEKPLASRAAGTLSLTDTDAALVLEARIDGGTSWSRDFLAAHASGLIRGLSPGFMVQPGGEKIENRGAGLLRTVTRAALFELSAVTVPAYPQAQIEARSWESHSDRQPVRGAVHPLNRWRA